jgi:gluconate kinase
VGFRNFLIEGVSGSGKTSVCTELERRGYQAIHGDRVLAYVGDPETGDPVPDNVTPAGHAANCGCWDCLAWLSERWLWDLDQVRTIASDVGQPMTFFCGGSRNFSKVIDLFDAVFVLDVDLVTLLRRLKQRPEHEFGGKQSERDLVALQNRTREDRLLDRRVPDDAILIDTSQPIAQVVDEVLRRAEEIDRPRKLR